MLAGLALAAWGAIIAVGRVWGIHLMSDGRKIVLFTPPLLGHYRTQAPALVWLPALVGALTIAVLPWAASRLRWWQMAAATTLASLAWWIALAVADGDNGLARGLEWEREYESAVRRASVGPGDFLRTFVPNLSTESIQIRGHPPGFPLLMGVLDRAGLRGPGWAAALVLLVGATSVPALLIAVRDVVGTDAARRLAPFVALAPAALWMATSADALYVGVTSWVVALLVLATGCDRRRSIVLSCSAGLLAATAALLSYGMVLMAFVPLMVAWYRHSWRPLLIAGGVAVVLVVALVPLGFWWFAGLAATRAEYYTLDVDRPYGYFLVNNLSAWALALGPAVAVGFALLRDRRAWLLAGGGVAAVVFADLSGLSAGEVERIWLPFTVWAAVAVLALAPSRGEAYLWTTVQAAFTLVLFSLVGTYW